MSIANEVDRIIKAKSDIKLSLEKRGADMTDSMLDEFSGKLDLLPYSVKGTFTPESDTDTFEVNGLSFVPEFVLVFNDELYNTDVNGSVSMVMMRKNGVGNIRYRDLLGSLKVAGVSEGSSMVQWKSDGCVVTIPSAQNTGYFKAGYTYGCLYTGGVE